MGLSLLLRDWKLVSNGTSMGRVEVFSCSLEAGEDLSKYGIRWFSIRWWCFGIFIGVRIYIGPLFVVLFTSLCSSCTKTCLLLIIIFSVKKNHI
jgi:hypothetical protein